MEEIYVLLIKHFSKNSTHEGEKRVAEFKEANPVEYDMLKEFWRRGDVKIHDFNTEKAWKKVIEKSGIHVKTINIRSTLKRIAAVAAVLIIAITSYFIFRPNSPELLTYSNNTENPISLKLSDGSEVCLNKDASLTYPERFNAKDRKVKLTGIAFFSVEKDTCRPFIIATNNSLITVIGTSFNVNSLPGFTEVNVESGTVKVISENTSETVILKKGFSAIVNNTQLISFTTENPNYQSWKTGVFEFNNTPIQQVIKDVNTYYSDMINIDTTQVYNCNLTASFTNAEITEILQVLELTCNITIVKINNKYKIESK